MISKEITFTLVANVPGSGYSQDELVEIIELLGVIVPFPTRTSVLGV